MITNEIFSAEEKRLLDFVLQQKFENKNEVIHYINSLSGEHIVRDYSPCYKIIEFRTPDIKDGYVGMSDIIRIQTIRDDGSAPTVFTLYSKDGFPHPKSDEVGVPSWCAVSFASPIHTLFCSSCLEERKATKSIITKAMMTIICANGKI